LHAATAEGVLGEVVNTGSGFEISIGDTVRLIATLMKAEVDIVQDGDRVRPAASEVERLFAAIDGAELKLGWKPDYAGRDGFARGLEQTIAWFSNPTNLARYKTDLYHI
jgi:dTDP-glucose 4,6-dehydratase